MKSRGYIRWQAHQPRARLSTLNLEVSARREVRRAVELMVTEADGRTVAHLRTTASTFPGTNNIDPEPI
jgi:hypothetical protein